MKMPKLSLSPKVLQILVAVVFIVVLTISYDNIQSKKITEGSIRESNSQLLVDVKREIENKDDDDDLLANWEEELWGTDPNNPDTDGDETIDGIEVSLDRDPNIAGPDDRIQQNIDAEDYNFPDLTIGENSFTQEKGVDLFTKVLESNFDPNSNLDPEELVNEVQLEANEILDDITSSYTENNIITVETNEENLKTYLSELTIITLEEYDNLSKTTPKDAVEVNNEILKTFEKIEGRLVSIEVPEIISRLHLEYISSYNLLSKYYKIILDEEEDPLLAYYAVPKFNNQIERNNQLLAQIVSYYKNNDIIFDEDDPAFQFFINSDDE